MTIPEVQGIVVERLNAFFDQHKAKVKELCNEDLTLFLDRCPEAKDLVTSPMEAYTKIWSFRLFFFIRHHRDELNLFMKIAGSDAYNWYIEAFLKDFDKGPRKSEPLLITKAPFKPNNEHHIKTFEQYLVNNGYKFSRFGDGPVYFYTIEIKHANDAFHIGGTAMLITLNKSIDK